MGVYEDARKRLSKRLRAEREQRGWSQAFVADTLGLPGVYASTIAKIEVEHRCVRAEELSAFADLYNMSADALLGRKVGGTDVAWAASKLASSAQKIIPEISALYDRLAAEAQDVIFYAARDNQQKSVYELLAAAGAASAALLGAQQAVTALANQFPLVGVKQS